MQREHTFFRGRAWLAVAVSCLFVASLSACGGGGGDGEVTPKMTITPTPTGDFARAIAEAPTITPGETVTASLESADDVKYHRLEVAETSTIELMIDAEAGIEIALLDSHEAVLATAVTASEATERITVQRGSYFVRVKDALRRGARSAKKGYSFVARAFAVATNINSVINIIRGIPDVDLNAYGFGVVLDLTDYFGGPDDRVPDFRTAKFGVAAPGLTLTIEQTKLSIRPNTNVGPGVVRVTVYASIPGLPGAAIPFSVEIGVEGLRVKPEFSVAGGTFSQPAGERRRTNSLESYFEYQIEATSNNAFLTDLIRGWRYIAAIQADNTGWTAEIVGGILIVGAPSNAEDGSAISVHVTVKDRLGSTATVKFAFSVGENSGMQPVGSPDTDSPSGYSCMSSHNSSRTHLSVCIHYRSSDGLRACLAVGGRQVSECPRTGGEEFVVITSCREADGRWETFDYHHSSNPSLRGSAGIRSRNILIETARSSCSGTFSIHKQ